MKTNRGRAKILDMTRLISIVILITHFYYYCYIAFHSWELTAPLAERILGNIRNTGLFNNFHKSKVISLGFLMISLLGAKGRKDKKVNYKTAFSYVTIYLAVIAVIL